jgi:rhodanese-related sulfurtransferase
MRARVIALSGASGRAPKPSRIRSTTGRGAEEGFVTVVGGCGRRARRNGRAATLRYHSTFADLAARRAPMSLLAFIEKNWMLITVAFVSGAMLVWPLVQRRFSAMKEVGTHVATQLINRDALVLDVREPKEVEGGRLPNAVHIPLSQLDARVGEIASHASRPVVAYCARGQRSRGAGAALAKAGFKDIYHLTGGLAAWRGAGLPVEK